MWALAREAMRQGRHWRELGHGHSGGAGARRGHGWHGRGGAARWSAGDAGVGRRRQRWKSGMSVGRGHGGAGVRVGQRGVLWTR